MNGWMKKTTHTKQKQLGGGVVDVWVRCALVCVISCIATRMIAFFLCTFIFYFCVFGVYMLCLACYLFFCMFYKQKRGWVRLHTAYIGVSQYMFVCRGSLVTSEACLQTYIKCNILKHNITCLFLFYFSCAHVCVISCIATRMIAFFLCTFIFCFMCVWCVYDVFDVSFFVCFINKTWDEWHSVWHIFCVAIYVYMSRLTCDFRTLVTNIH